LQNAKPKSTKFQFFKGETEEYNEEWAYFILFINFKKIFKKRFLKF
jgi:hypothetical protein